MSQFTGTWALTRFTLRRDRMRVVLWVVVIVLLVWVTAASTKGLYPTQADLDRAAATSRDSTAAIAFNGPPLALNTLGGQLAFQLGTFLMVLMGLMTLLLTSRWTRGEEESGRSELVRSLPVGRHAALTAAIGVVVAMNVLIGAATSLLLLSLGLPVAGSVAMGVSCAAVGVVFAAVTAVTAQVSENGRVSSGLAGVVLGAAFVIRAIGDIGGGALSWLSPIGWSQKVRPFAGEAWWPLLVPAAATVLLAVVAGALLSHRDAGGGLVAPRRGPPQALPRLGTPSGLAARLERGTILWWAVSLAVLGAVYGSIAHSVEDFVKDNPTLEKVIAASGHASITDAYLGRSLLVVALIGAGFAVQSALRPRAEENALRADVVLATGVSRRRWLGTQLGVTAVGAVVVLVAGGAGMGLAAAVATGKWSLVWRMIAGACAYVPAMWALVALTALCIALVPRFSLAVWGAVALFLLIGFFRELLDLPQWVADLSPFEQTPRIPAIPFDAVPLVVLTLATAGLAVAALAAFARRDLARA